MSFSEGSPGLREMADFWISMALATLPSAASARASVSISGARPGRASLACCAIAKAPGLFCLSSSQATLFSASALCGWTSMTVR